MFKHSGFRQEGDIENKPLAFRRTLPYNVRAGGLEETEARNGKTSWEMRGRGDNIDPKP